MKKLFRLQSRDELGNKVILVAADDEQKLRDAIMVCLFRDRPQEIKIANPEELANIPCDIFIGG